MFSSALHRCPTLRWLIHRCVSVLSVCFFIAACAVRRAQQLRHEARTGASARVVWCPPAAAANERQKRLAQQIARIVDTCESLRRPRYIPPVFAAGSYSNLALFILKDTMNWLFRQNTYWRERLVCMDGGVISVDWANDTLSQSLPHTAPIVIYLHTITGSVNNCFPFMREAARRGWRSCVFNRRGHGGEPLQTAARFNLMGDAADTKLQVEMVQKRYPHTSFISMCGISAGSGLLVTYLGKEGDNTPVQAACSLCPAYDITKAFSNLSKNYPIIDRLLTANTKYHFLERNKELLYRANAKAANACIQTKTVHELLQTHFPFAGFTTLAEYYADSNPMEHIDTIARPLLLVNADDDIVCTKENIREDLAATMAGALLLRTKRGSHIAYNEGCVGQGSYLVRVSMDFLDAARKIREEEENHCSI